MYVNGKPKLVRCGTLHEEEKKSSVKGNVMKKLLVVLAVLVVAVPAMADVTLTCTPGVDGWVTVSYDAAAEATLVRAFALDIEVDGGSIVDVVNLNADYDVHPGSFDYDADEETYSGNLVCDSSFPGTLGGIGTDGVTTEQGSLYVPGVDVAPLAAADLLKFQVACDGFEGSVTVTVVENEARGGVVLEDPAVDPTVVSDGCALDICDVAVCWGDVSSGAGAGVQDDQVSLSDINYLIGLLVDYSATGYVVDPIPAGYENGDVSSGAGAGVQDSKLSLSDINYMISHLVNYEATGYVGPCMNDLIN